MKWVAGAAIACVGLAVIVRHLRGPADERPVGLLRGFLYIDFALLLSVGSEVPVWAAGIMIACLLAAALGLVIIGVNRVGNKLRP